MSQFAVQPSSLREMADMLDRQGMHTGAVRMHLEPVAVLQTSGGVFDAAGHSAAIGAIQDWFYDLGMLCVESGTRVRDAAGYYQRTDRDTARTFDETEFPDDVYVTDAREGSGYVPVEPPEGTATFADVTDPQDKVSPPISTDDYELSEMNGMDWWEALSVSSVMNETFTKASSVLAFLGLIDRTYNPLEELFRPWVGDWAGVKATGDALDHVGSAASSLAFNLRWASQGCEQVWQGNAGDGATVFTMILAERPMDLCVPLKDLGKDYRAAAEDMVEYRDALISTYKLLIDTCVEIAAAGAVAGGATATGVGAPVGGLAAIYMAYKASKFLQYLDELFGFIGDLNDVVTLLKGAYGSFDTGSAQLPSLPVGDIPAPS